MIPMQSFLLLAVYLAVLLALVGSLTLPLWILAVGPLVLGVPHLLADVRYLVARKGLQRSRRLVIGVGLPLLVCGLGGGMPAGLCAMLGALRLGEGDTFRKLINSAMANASGKQIWAGIGAYKQTADRPAEKIKATRGLGAQGFILFSYASSGKASPHLNPPGDYLEKGHQAWRQNPPTPTRPSRPGRSARAAAGFRAKVQPPDHCAVLLPTPDIGAGQPAVDR